MSRTISDNSSANSIVQQIVTSYTNNENLTPAFDVVFEKFKTNEK